mgnify:CR=1 FL=1
MSNEDKINVTKDEYQTSEVNKCDDKAIKFDSNKGIKREEKDNEIMKTKIEEKRTILKTRTEEKKDGDKAIEEKRILKTTIEEKRMILKSKAEDVETIDYVH